MSALSPTTDRTASDRVNGSAVFVVALLCAIAFIAYVQRLSISTTAGPIGADLDFNKQQLGRIMAAFGWGYALFQIPAGWITDAWGTRRTLSMAALGWSLALGGLAAANGFWQICSLWLVFGMIQSAVFSCATRSLRDWLPERVWAKANGALTSAMYLGGGVTTLLTAQLLSFSQISWRDVYLLYAVPGIAWAAFFAWWFRDRPPAAATGTADAIDPAIAPAEPEVRLRSTSALTTLSILSMPSVWALMAQQFCRASAYVFFATWFPTFLQEMHGVTLVKSGALGSLPLFATIAGCLVGGLFADWLLAWTGSLRASRQIIAVPGLLLSGIAIACSLLADDALLAVTMFSIGGFGVALAGVAAFTSTLDLGRDRVGTLFSFMNAAGNIGGAAFPLVVGEIIHHTGDWTIVVWLCAGLYFTAAACWMFIDPDATPSLTQEIDPVIDRLLLPMPTGSSHQPDPLALAAVPLSPLEPSDARR
jgi:ACS family glucarate transporter-like MFS transporter